MCILEIFSIRKYVEKRQFYPFIYIYCNTMCVAVGSKRDYPNKRIKGKVL